ncbi:hypothetical protein [Gordonia sp. (in: high G+C Gram-positive bacteria)]|uniref:hypothetical protein n=1 Tax=Gordonia sp. (in: high G+C Gram-positive bacteria) TaxID=84139 RepID=UPI001D230E1B|nr:hypothetical protein [Gordonia sp. (in: high G+C Gram-positive bacteria)]MCB1293067.1 hypothetical protein [Gordonia sp. (in: high G+C Gram-positive bacteria)]HMS74640.1 hypothetical protein [Gordonia sp. (in: high G+C Gram-positive bacteria)]HQV17881.1 hypothetical protein [Gordonia sp. (in: high G+C Gram-positive bacteria)]
MSWFHPVEEHQVGAILGYQDEYPGTRYLIAFADGESYVCVYFTSYESENGGEVGVEMYDPEYDEFYVVSFDIVGVIANGNWRYNDTLSVDYRDFPVKITDVDTGATIYPESATTR